MTAARTSTNALTYRDTADAHVRTIAHNPPVEPEIRYCTTEDGVSIAYCEAGEGTPVVSAAPLSNIELESRWEWYRIMTARRRLIWYDNRGAGSSQRDVPGLSIEEMALDIGAVTVALALDTFVLIAQLSDVPVAVAYAAKHP